MFVGVEVTRINAMPEVSPAGIVTDKGSRPRFWDRAIIMGITIVAVTVLLEKATFNKETNRTTEKICRYKPRFPIPPSRRIESQLAAPL